MLVGREKNRNDRFYFHQVGEPLKDFKSQERIRKSSETSIISSFSSGKLIRKCKKIASVIFFACT